MYLKTEAGDIYYEVHGPEGAPVVVLTHGATLNSGAFAAQVAALKDRYRVVVWDMHGHGRSYKLDGPFSVTRNAAYIVEILDQLNVDQAVLCGHSLSSWVIQYAAGEYPERVQAMVSIAGGPIHKPIGKGTIAMYRVMNSMFRLMPAESLYRWVARSKARTTSAQEFMLQAMRELGIKQFYHIMDGMVAWGSNAIPAPSQPLLITHGEFEMPKYVVKMNFDWHRETPSSKYTVIAGAGHNANQDNPEGFNEALLAFLEELA